MLNSLELHLINELVLVVNTCLTTEPILLSPKIRIILPWKAWKTLDLWISGIAFAIHDKQALYDLHITTGAAKTVCAASFDPLINKITTQTSTTSGHNVSIEFNVHELTL